MGYVCSLQFTNCEMKTSLHFQNKIVKTSMMNQAVVMVKQSVAWTVISHNIYYSMMGYSKDNCMKSHTVRYRIPSIMG